MMSLISILWHYLDTHAPWLLAAGLCTSAVYQALRWQKDRRRLKELSQSSNNNPIINNYPLVSILVPAWDEEINLPSCMYSLLNLRYPNKEIILCAGGTDSTYQISKSFATHNVLVLEQRPNEGKQHALQRCFEISHGEVIFLTDADCIMEDYVFEATLYPILMKEEDVTSGAWRPWDRILQNSLVQYQWSHHLFREAWLADNPPTFDGRNSAIRREVIENAQPFMEEASTGTDYVQSKKITAKGYKIFHVRGSRVQTEYPEKVTGYWKQLSRWFRTSLLMSKRWNDEEMEKSALWAGLTSLILILSIPTLMMRIFLVIWLAVVFHLALNQTRVSDLARNYQGPSIRLRVKFALLQVFLPISWIGNVRGLIDSLVHQRRQNW